MTGQVASILTTLGIGALCALILILFVLPSLLVLFDKHVVKKWVFPVQVVDAVGEDVSVPAPVIETNNQSSEENVIESNNPSSDDVDTII
jgi:hypothetical protein